MTLNHIASIRLQYVAGVFSNPNRIPSICYKLWWEVNAVFSLSALSALICQYQPLVSNVQITSTPPEVFINSCIYGKGYDLIIVMEFNFLRST